MGDNRRIGNLSNKELKGMKGPILESDTDIGVSLVYFILFITF